MKIKTSELSGVQLDWAVYRVYYGPASAKDFTPAYKAEEDWEKGWTIMQYEKITLRHYKWNDGESSIWEAEYYEKGKRWIRHQHSTPLVAVMKCFVASRLGEEVEVPDEIQEDVMVR